MVRHEAAEGVTRNRSITEIPVGGDARIDPGLRREPGRKSGAGAKHSMLRSGRADSPPGVWMSAKAKSIP